jgi:hypothetical protein
LKRSGARYPRYVKEKFTAGAAEVDPKSLNNLLARWGEKSRALQSKA